MMNYQMPNEDAYWEHVREQREYDPVITTCDCCGNDITKSEANDEGYYVIDGAEVCFHCLYDYFSDCRRYE